MVTQSSSDNAMYIPMPEEYLLIFFFIMQLLFFSVLFASCTHRQQDHLSVDDDGRNVTFLAKTEFAQDFSNFAAEIQKTIKALREQVCSHAQIIRPYCIDWNK